MYFKNLIEMLMDLHRICIILWIGKNCDFFPGNLNLHKNAVLMVYAENFTIL